MTSAEADQPRDYYSTIIKPIEKLVCKTHRKEVEIEEDGQQEEEKGDNNSEEDEIIPALNLLKALKQFKNHVFHQHLQKVAAGICDEAEEISTSDIHYQLEDIIKDT
ncbi:MAG: hypothetical protein M1839_009293 [Geoglossum umbratile]|nr:MAG: hypothetical protein M1839_009293 [Geoglossum umbratile]